MGIRTVVLEKDTASRKLLRSILVADPEIRLVAECETARQTANAIREFDPSLMFLSLQIRDLDCLKLREIRATKTLPATILMVPEDSTMKSLDVRALGYLVTPISEKALLVAVQRAKTYIRSQHRLENDSNGSERLRGVPLNSNRIIIRSEGRFIFLKTEDIEWVKAEGNYVRLHTGSDSYFCRESMTAFESGLDPRFVRIHRSAIVNVDKIKELRPWPTGEYVVIMQTGKELTLSRSYRQQFQSLVGVPTKVDRPALKRPSSDDQSYMSDREVQIKENLQPGGAPGLAGTD